MSSCASPKSAPSSAAPAAWREVGPATPGSTKSVWRELCSNSHKLVAVFGLALTAIQGCGIDADSEPRRIPDGALPPALVAPGTTATPVVETVDRTLFFAVTNSERLASLSVPVPVNEGNPFSAALVTLIKNEPSDAQLINRIPSETDVLGVEFDPATGVLTVNLSEALQEIEGEFQVQAFAQLVFTATEFPTVTRGVRFLIEGQPRGTPIEGGIKPANETVTRSDYRALDPTLPTTTSTTRPPETSTSQTTAPGPSGQP